MTSNRKPYASADSAKPSPQEPCSTPLMKPRERASQDSIARAAPAGHSAPIPIPSKARKKNKNAKLGENPAMKLQSEYQRMEIRRFFAERQRTSKMELLRVCQQTFAAIVPNWPLLFQLRPPNWPAPKERMRAEKERAGEGRPQVRGNRSADEHP